MSMIVTTFLLPVCSTIAGSVAIEFTHFYLQERLRKKDLFNALYEEIKRNHLLSQKMANSEDKIVVGKNTVCTNPDFKGFAMDPFHTTSYENMRTAGKTLSLPKNLRQKLDDTYESIYSHNRQCREKSSSDDQIDIDFVRLIINKELKDLEEGIPKYYLSLKLKFKVRKKFQNSADS